MNFKTIYLCSDRKYDIKSLTSPIVAFSLVKKCRIVLAEIKRTKTIYIVCNLQIVNMNSDIDFIAFIAFYSTIAKDLWFLIIRQLRCAMALLTGH